MLSHPTASSLTAIMGSKPGACDGKLVKATANPLRCAHGSCPDRRVQNIAC